MLLLEAGCGVVGVTLAGVTLAWLARRLRRPWAVTGSLLLGPDDQEGAEYDIRFVSFVLATSIVLAAAVLFPDLLRSLSPGQLAFFLILVLPVLALCLALLADGFRRLGLGREEDQEGERDEALRELLERAGHEVSLARSRVEDPIRMAALEALGEAVVEYGQAAKGEGEEVDLDERLRGVITLARSCLADEEREAARVLGVRSDSSSDEVRAVFEALSRLYGGPEPLPGTDPAKQEELEVAYERLKVRARRAA